MTAKEYLKQYEEATRKALRYKTEYETELALIDTIRSPLGGDGMPHGSGISRKTEDQAIRLSDKAVKWREAQIDALRLRQEVFDFVRDIPGIEGEILYQRYVCLRRWEEVCILVHYSWNGIHKAHRRALAIVQERLDN